MAVDPTSATVPQSSTPASAPSFQQISAMISGDGTAKPPPPVVSSGTEPAPVAASAPEVAPSMIESARFVQTAGRSEMHIGINSESLGTVDVHAVMHNDTSGAPSVGASITVQSHEAAAMLTKELPALQGHLEGRNVHIGEIAVIPESLSAGSGMQQQGGPPQESYPRQPRSPYAAANGSGLEREGTADSAAHTSWVAGNGRLSVMA